MSPGKKGPNREEEPVLLVRRRNDAPSSRTRCRWIEDGSYMYKHTLPVPHLASRSKSFRCFLSCRAATATTFPLAANKRILQRRKSRQQHGNRDKWIIKRTSSEKLRRKRNWDRRRNKPRTSGRGQAHVDRESGAARNRYRQLDQTVSTNKDVVCYIGVNKTRPFVTILV